MSYVFRRLTLLTGLVLIMGCQSSETDIQQVASESTPEVQNEPRTESPSASHESTIKFRVPDMHCRSACWPEVQESLAELPAVAKVELAPQKGKNKIDLPVITVHLKQKLDQDTIIRQLADWGYENAEVVTD